MIKLTLTIEAPFRMGEMRCALRQSDDGQPDELLLLAVTDDTHNVIVEWVE